MENSYLVPSKRTHLEGEVNEVEHLGEEYEQWIDELEAKETWWVSLESGTLETRRELEHNG